MKTKTIMIEDTNRYDYRRRLEEVLNRYSEEEIYNIDTGVEYDGLPDSSGNPVAHYYAFIIIKYKYKEGIMYED